MNVYAGSKIWKEPGAHFGGFAQMGAEIADRARLRAAGAQNSQGQQRGGPHWNAAW